MLTVLSTTNIILVVTLSVVLYIMLRQPSSRAQVLFVIFDCFLIVFIFGLELELIHSETVEAALSGLAVQYLGQCGFLIALLAFVGEFVYIRIPRPVYILQGLLSAVTLSGVLTAGKNQLFYTSMRIISDGAYPRIECTDGVLWYVHYIYFFVVFIACIVMCLFRYRHSSEYHKKRILCMVTGFAILLGELLMKATGLFGAYNPVSIALFGMVAAFLVALLRYSYFDTIRSTMTYMTDYMDEGLIILNPIGKFVFLNRKARELFPDIAEGSLLSDKRNVMEMFLSEQEDTFTIHGDQWELRREEMKEKDRSIGTMLHFLNVTEQQEELRKAKEADRKRRQFMMEVSHELRSPLNVIVGADEMILRSTQDEQLREFAGMIRNEAGSMLSLISDITEVMMDEGTGVVLEEHPFSLRDVLLHLCSAYEIQAAGKGLAFSALWDGMPVADHEERTLYGDDSRISQILNNLLSNALKYTEKGEIRLSIATEPLTEAGGVRMTAEVRDTGIGIAEEDREKIFMKFERGSGAHETGSDGLGLGLPIVKELTGVMGGTLDLESRPGGGSAFTVTIPLKEAETAVPEQAPDVGDKAVHAVDFSGKKILVVEDRRQNIELIRHFLKESGIEIHASPDGETALEACRETTFDALLIDYRMPGMNGPETLEKIKADPRGMNGRTYAILFSANVTHYVEQSYREAGFDDFLRKPVYPEDLRKALTMAFGAGSPNRVPADANRVPIDEDTFPAGMREALAAAGVDVKKGLAYADDDPAFYRQLLSVFADNFERDRGLLLQAAETIRAGQNGSGKYRAAVKEFVRIAHSIKGELRGLGDENGGELFYILEQAGREENFLKAETALPPALKHWEKLTETIHSY